MILSNKAKTLKKTSRKVNEKNFPIVAFGASAGGLDAISIILKNLPSNTGMAFIYVQHLSPDHKSFLTAILSKLTSMKVQEIEDMEQIAPNNFYIIPPNKGIEVTDGHIILLPRSKTSVAISINVLFSSLAQTHKRQVIGVVLSGYASDGMIGLKAIKAAGGLTIAQDDSAQASSMPHAAISSGVVDFVLSPKEISEKLIAISKTGMPFVSSKQAKLILPIIKQSNDLNQIFEMLLAKTGVDFSHYKISTIKRRLNHKMLELGIKDVKFFVKYLQKNKGEIDLLYNDFLINVTSFMRDKEVFQYLKSSIIPKLLKTKTSEETIRIWVPACSSGEEVYSIAMIISELQENSKSKVSVKIFGTDVSEKAISAARIGVYSELEIGMLPEKYLSKYFIKSAESYSIKKELRDLCIFAPHNILRDPPFSKMDLISCRNLLIYFDGAAQKKVFSILHFALAEKGYLILGKAETVGASSTYFTNVSGKNKIYSRKNNNDSKKSIELLPRFQTSDIANSRSNLKIKSGKSNPSGIEVAIDSAILTNYTPACVVINKELEILQFRGAISVFLKHPEGKASLNILKMIRQEFAFELRNAIYKFLKSKQKFIKSDIEIEIESTPRIMSFEISNLKIDWDEPLLLIVFRLNDKTENLSDEKSIGKSKSTFKDRRIKKLIDELNKSRTEMNAIIETHEQTYEDLQSASEEIVSSNEEFQTLNEELETSKEEIEATNEELVTANNELQTRNDMLTESHEYSQAIIATIHESMLILKKDFRVKSANSTFYEKFKVTQEETVGKYLFDLGNKQWDIPELKVVLNEILFENKGFENFQVTHTFPGIGKKIILLNASLIIQKANNEALILLAIEDITERMKYQIKEKHSLSLIEASLDPLVTIDNDGKITDLNQAMTKITGVQREKLMGTVFFNYFTEPKKAHEAYQKVLDSGSVAESPLTLLHKDGAQTEVLFNGSVFKDEHGKIMGEVIVARDVTNQNQNAKELMEAKVFAELAAEIAIEAKRNAEQATLTAESAMKAKQQFLSNMSHEIRTPMNAIIGFTKILMKTDLSEKQVEFLSAIKLSGDALIVLINDILDLAKVDSGKMTFENIPFNLNFSLSAMLQLFDQKIKEKNLRLIKELDLKIPEVLIGDPVRLNQIILNLVSNAVKFTPTGSITLSTNILKQNDDSVTLEFSVRDTGIGIEENKLDTIFENFQQATSSISKKYGGTGLGLAIVKQLVESQGGTVRVKSELNKGSLFSFILEFGKTKQVIKVNTETPDIIKTLNTINVLVVEDIALNQLLMKTLLDDFGFENDIVSNGKIALQAMKKKSYDIILMDLHMPEMNGFETTSYIRNKLKFETPIIALTADVTTVDVAKCKEAGMDDYIAKPIDEKLLYNKIVELLLKPSRTKPLKPKPITALDNNILKLTSLEYMIRITRSNPALMIEMIGLYLKQTPLLIEELKAGAKEHNWSKLGSVAHRLIPSFTIVGISSEHENVARKIQENAQIKENMKETLELVSQLDYICFNACKEMEEEYKTLEKKAWQVKKS